jgi:hypothetical protein
MPTPIEPLTTVLEHLIDITGCTLRGGDAGFDNHYWLAQAQAYTQDAPELRTTLVHLKLSAVEKMELERRAREAGQTMSDYARMRIFGNA